MALPDPREEEEAGDSCAELTVLDDGAASPTLVNPASLGPGSLGRYQNPSPLGRGGMGVVLAATDPQIERLVAIKVLHPQRARDPVHLRKFLNEAKVTGRLEHPNIVPIYDLGRTPGGEPYFSMKLVRGQTLEHALEGLARRRSTRRALEQRTRLLREFLKVCDAVAFAHSKGVVHRDLKPANVMIGEFGEVLVMDWGLARVLSGREARSAEVVAGPPDGSSLGNSPSAIRDPLSDTDPLRTADGTVMGTPAFMPPEQAAGKIEEIGERSDIYSLGAILYQILTLTKPFEGENAASVLRQVLARSVEPPSVRAPDAGIPRELDAVVLKAMAPDRLDRYSSVPGLAADIEAHLGGFAVSAFREGPLSLALKWARRHKAVVAAAAVALLALGSGVAGVLALQERARRERVRSLLAEARESIRQGEFREGEELALQAMGLDRENRQASDAVLEAREMLERQERVAAVERRLAKAHSEAGRLGDPGDDEEARVRWYDSHLSWFELARELFDLDPDRSEHRAGLAEIARLLAQRYISDGDLDLALRMLRQGEKAGLVTNWEREMIDKAKLASGERARDILARTRRAVDGETREEELVAAARIDSMPLLMVFLRAAFSWVANRGHRELVWVPVPRGSFAIRTLGLVGGDGRRVPIPAHLVQFHNPGEATDPVLQELIRAEVRRAAGSLFAQEGQPWIEVDAVEALSIVLGSANTIQFREEAAAGIQALGRLADPRSAILVEIRRWDSGYDSGFWRTTGKDAARIPLPDAPPDADSPALSARALALIARGEGALAERLLDRLVESDHQNARLLWERGLARALAADAARALGDLDRAVELAPEWPPPRIDRARVRSGAGRLEEALEDAREAVRLDTRSERARRTLGKLLAASGDVAGALRELSAAADLDPDSGAALFERGRLRLAQGEALEAAIDLGEVCRREPSEPEHHLEHARALQRAGRPREGIQAVSEAILRDPENPDLYRLRGALYREIGDSKLAAKSLVAAADLAPSSWEIQMELGMAAFARHRPDMLYKVDSHWAHTAFDRAIALAPDREEAYLWRGLTRIELGDHDGAIRDLGRALEHDPAAVEALIGRARVLTGKERFEEAEVDLRRALEIAPDHAAAHLGYGELQVAAGELEKGVGSMRRAHDLAAGDPDIAAWIRRRLGTLRPLLGDGPAGRELETWLGQAGGGR